MRLGDYYDGFYRGYYAYLAPGTAQGYDGDWRNHIAGEFAAWEMEAIRVRHINAWLASDHFAGIGRAVGHLAQANGDSRAGGNAGVGHD